MLKRQSIKWKQTDSLLKKLWVQRSVKEVMKTAFWNRKGLIIWFPWKRCKSKQLFKIHLIHSMNLVYASGSFVSVDSDRNDTYQLSVSAKELFYYHDNQMWSTSWWSVTWRRQVLWIMYVFLWGSNIIVLIIYICRIRTTPREHFKEAQIKRTNTNVIKLSDAWDRRQD